MQPSSFSILIETGQFFASILQFDRAKEMFQQAFDESDAADKKTFAWQQVLKVAREQDKLIETFAQRIDAKQLVNQLEKPEEALKRADDAFKFLASSRDASQPGI